MTKTPKKTADKTKPPASGAAAVKTAPVKPSAPKTAEAKAAESKSSASKTAETKPSASKLTETKPSTSKTAESKPSAPKETETGAEAAKSPAAATPPPPKPKPAPKSGASGLLWTVTVLAVAFGGAVVTYPAWSPQLAVYIPALRKEPPRDPRVDAVADRLKALEERTRARQDMDQAIKDMEVERARFSQQLGTLINQVNTLDEALRSVRKMVEATALPAEAADANASLQQLKERFSKMEERGAAIEGLLERINKLEEARQAAKDAPSPQELASRNEQISSVVAEINQRIGALESAKAADPMAAAGAQAAVLAVGQLREVLRGEAPYAESLQSLKEVAADNAEIMQAVAPIEGYAASGVPTLVTLREQFAKVAARTSSAALAMEGEGWIAKTVNRLTSLVSVRRVGEKASDDPVDSALAAAETGLKAGDLMGAVKAMEGLSGPPAEAAAPWIADAKARLAIEKAMASLHVLSVSLMAPAKE